MVELQPSKLTVRVRFSSPAPNSQSTSFGMFFFIYRELKERQQRAVIIGRKWKELRNHEGDEQLLNFTTVMRELPDKKMDANS